MAAGSISGRGQSRMLDSRQETTSRGTGREAQIDANGILGGGKTHAPRFGPRIRGEGVIAQLSSQRMSRLQARLGMGRMRRGLRKCRGRILPEPGPVPRRGRSHDCRR